jgi:cell division protein FtsW (lipid II flippase)
MNKIKSAGIIFPIALLISIGAHHIIVKSPLLASLFYFDNPMYFAYKYLYGILFGVGIAYLMTRIDSAVWFDRIGKWVLILSLVMFGVLMVVPDAHHGLGEMIAPVVDGKHYIFKIGSIAVIPVFYWLIGIIWLAAYAREKENGFLTPNRVILSTMVLSAFIMIPLHDMNHLMFSELVLICILILHNGIGKLSLSVMLALIGMFSFLVLTHEHWMNIVDRWYDGLMGRGEPINTSLFAMVGNSWNIGMFAVFAVLLYTLSKLEIADEKRRFFLHSVMIIIAVDVFINLLGWIGLYPTSSPYLYLIDFVPSVTVAFFVMMGMLFMGKKSV